MGYFKDNKGNKSMMRLKVFMALVTALVLAVSQEIMVFYFEYISTIEHPREFPREFTVILGLLAYAGATKVIQKKYENQL